MHVTVPLKNLQSGLKIVAPARASKSPSPVLQHVRVAVSRGGLSLACTDLDLSIEHQVEAMVHQDCEPFTVDHKSLADWLGLVKTGGNVDLHLTDNILRVKVGRAKTELPVLPGIEFPSIHFSQGDAYTFEAGLLTEALRKVMVARAEGNKAHTAFNGVQFRFDSEGLTLFATTGRHMSWQTLPGDYPARTEVLAGVTQMLSVEGDLTLRVSDSTWCIESGPTRVGGRVLSAVMPPWEKTVGNMSPELSLNISRPDLISALRRVLLFAHDKDMPGLLRLDLVAGSLKLKAQSALNGSAEEEVTCGYEGEPYATALNGHFLADALSVLEVPNVDVDLHQDPTKPMRVRVGPWTYVLCPVRLMGRAAA